MSDRRPFSRRILQFSLRTILVLLTAACILLGLKSEKVRTQRAVLRLVKNYDGQAMYDYQYTANPMTANPITPNSPNPAPGPTLLRTVLGDDYFSDLVFVQVKNVGDNDIHDIAKQMTLRHLSVTGGLTDDALESISRLTHLETLEITGGRFSGAGLDQLSKLTNLRTLALRKLALSDEQAHSLGRLAQLETLSLHGSRIGSKQMEHLKSLRQLTALDLTSTLVGDDGLKTLYDLKELKLIQVGGSMTTPSGIRKLQAALPEAEVEATFFSNGLY